LSKNVPDQSETTGDMFLIKMKLVFSKRSRIDGYLWKLEDIA
jgi:hypothetical protein